MVKALVVVPPFIKYTSGPLLGPALLQSAARKAGHECRVVDLNATYIQSILRHRRVKHGRFLGDHDKSSSMLKLVESAFFRDCLTSSLGDGCRTTSSSDSSDLERRVRLGFLSHSEVSNAAITLASSLSTEQWWANHFEAEQHAPPPDVVGISLLHAGQVIPAAAISHKVRQIWPHAWILWGGPHISGLGRQTLEEDLMERSFAADVFVTGHAEQTFVDLLDYRGGSDDNANPFRFKPVVLDGSRGMYSALAPAFDNLHLYDRALTLPAQSTLGCSYGKCTYCTYPGMEPRPTKLDLNTSVESVVDIAERYGASLSVKDSLVTPTRMRELGGCVANRVPWSATTKLHRKFDAMFLEKVHQQGLTTLEVGLESLLPETQRRVKKIQPEDLFQNFVRAAASVPELTLVVNYMTNFPWEDPMEAMEKLEYVQWFLSRHMGARAQVEQNDFELERLAPMARFPEMYGIQSTKSWPWASVLEHRSTDMIDK